MSRSFRGGREARGTVAAGQNNTMSDDELLAAFEDGSLPHVSWTHRAHVRVAFVYLSRCALPEAIEQMRIGIRRYNAVHGVSDGPKMGYHETTTQAFVRLIHQVMEMRGPFQNSDAFCECNEELLEKRVLLCYYSRERIMSAQARIGFVEPDLAALDEIGMTYAPSHNTDISSAVPLEPSESPGIDVTGVMSDDAQSHTL